MVDSYDVAFHESPVVVGHPQHNHPAYAWVKSLQLDGDVLKAEFDQIDPEFAEMVETGRFKKYQLVSIRRIAQITRKKVRGIYDMSAF
ncbi:Uncharacterised protein [Actinobacillus equuli]|nr:Uncharacterised protein [Actinobacillus equuli]